MIAVPPNRHPIINLQDLRVLTMPSINYYSSNKNAIKELQNQVKQIR